MKKQTVWALAMMMTTAVWAMNPLIEHLYTADPSIHQWSNGMFYLYCSHDRDDATAGWNMDDYHVFSSPDLVNWQDHGVAFTKDMTGWVVTDGGNNVGPLWAPDCAEYKGKYYFYFPQSCRYIGVAESSSPTGPFADPVIMHDTFAENGINGGSLDPAVYFEDGVWYLIYKEKQMIGGTPVKQFVLETLDPSMKKGVPGSRKVIKINGGGIHEGPYIFKREDIYYLLSGGNQTHYFTSTNLAGPYTHQGVLIDDGPGFPTVKTQHNSVINVDGKWILFWHFEADGFYRRRIGASYLNFNPDGTLQRVIPNMRGIDPVGCSSK